MEPLLGASQAPLHTKHTQRANVLFRVKASGLQVRRAVLDAKYAVLDAKYLVKRHGKSPDLIGFPLLLAESKTPLWTSENIAEKRLQLGKVQNLRLAIRAINGVVIPADTVFSFWRHVGRATASRGFVAGRELREGCLIPSVGGGLCQLSNALYELALRTDCEIIERHSHSHIVPGSAAVLGRDATVFWNYIDLRFAPSIPLKIEALMSADTLVIRFWSDQKPEKTTPATLPKFKRMNLLTPVPQGCDACGEGDCDQHNTTKAIASRVEVIENTAFVLEECWPEFQDWLTRTRTVHNFSDIILFPMAKGRYNWDRAGFKNSKTAMFYTLFRSLQARKKQTPPQRRAWQLLGATQLAEILGKQIPPDATHLVVSQTLLPALWEQGWLGGRTFDVLMTRIPLTILHQQLDNALHRRPEATLLGDFRAPESLLRAETEALAAARKIITPHSAIAACFPQKSEKLAWQLPQNVRARVHNNSSRTIAFAGPTAARKGAYAVREAARELNLTVRLRGSEREGANFWDGVQIERAETLSPNLSSWLEGVTCVVQPAVAEDAPRPLLYALCANIPVLASLACGLQGVPNVQEILPDDTESLIHALQIIHNI